MKKVFITGGTGTVGRAFIDKYYNEYKFYSFARNEKQQVSLKRAYPKVEIIIGGIENKPLLRNEINKSCPDIIIHAAALKHVDTAEKQPSQAVLSNIIGSYNVIESAIECGVNLTVGISTDKACSPDSIYGQTKYIMERMFMEANTHTNKFVCCRFGNVAWSNGSVIPFWLSLDQEKKPLPLTDPTMTRLMFSKDEAATLIKDTIQFSNKEGGFICSKKMKTVQMVELAAIISDQVDIVGCRPGEKLYEDLISKKEIPFTYVNEDYIFIKRVANPDISGRLGEMLSSRNAEKMSEVEMIDLVNQVNDIFNRKAIELKNY